MQGPISHDYDLKLDPELDREPMQLNQEGSGMGVFVMLCQKPSSSILNTLQPFQGGIT